MAWRVTAGGSGRGLQGTARSGAVRHARRGVAWQIGARHRVARLGRRGKAPTARHGDTVWQAGEARHGW